MSVRTFTQIIYISFHLACVSLFADGQDTKRPITIWPLGDSITYGAGHEGGYRETLFVELRERGYDVDFVGSTTENAGSILTEAKETEHDGHSGFSIMDSTNRDGLKRNGIYSHLEEWSSGFDSPDFVLLMIGTNDLNPDYKVKTAPDRLSTLLDKLTGLCPDSKILVATLLKAGENPFRHYATSDLAKAIKDYNDAIFSVVENQKLTGRNIECIDMYPLLELQDLSDNLHPSAEGYAKMGKKWAEAIMEIITPSMETTGE